MKLCVSKLPKHKGYWLPSVSGYCRCVDTENRSPPIQIFSGAAQDMFWQRDFFSPLCLLSCLTAWDQLGIPIGQAVQAGCWALYRVGFSSACVPALSCTLAEWGSSRPVVLSLRLLLVHLAPKPFACPSSGQCLMCISWCIHRGALQGFGGF